MADLFQRLALLISAQDAGASSTITKIGDVSRQQEAKVAGLAHAAGTIGSAFAAVQIGQFANEVGQSASRLEQSVGATASVFKDARGTIDAFAKTSAESVGLAEAEFRELSTVSGAMLKNLGFDISQAAEQSITLVKVGADLAATYGGTTREAVQALGAALRGEADPAERFGLRLNQNAVNAKALELGLAKTTSQVSASAKGQATMALILEQSADAQGQFAREAGSAAGAQQRANAAAENAKAAFGQAMAPAMALAYSQGARLLNVFNELPEGIQATIGTVGLLGAGVGSLIRPISDVARIVESVRAARVASAAATTAETVAENANTAAKVANTTATGAQVVVQNSAAAVQSLYLRSTLNLSAALGPLGIAATAGAAAFAITSYANAQRDAARAHADFTQALASEADQLNTNVDKVTAHALAEKDAARVANDAGISWQLMFDTVRSGTDDFGKLERATRNHLRPVADTLEEAGAGSTELGRKLIELGRSGNLSRDQIRGLLLALEGLHNDFVRDSGTAEAERQALSGIGTAAADAKPKLSALDEAIGNLRDTSGPDAQAAAVRKIEEAAKRVVTEYGNVLSAQQSLADSALGLEGSSLAREDALARVGEARAKLGTGTTAAENAQFQRDYERAVLDAERAVVAEAKAFAEDAEAQRVANGEKENATRKAQEYQQKLQELTAEIGGPVREGLDELIAKLQTAGSTYEAKLRLDAGQFMLTFEMVKDALAQGIDLIEYRRRLEDAENARERSQATDRRVTARAVGGGFQGPTDLIAGEYGPERIRIAAGVSGHVFNAADTRRMTTGGTSFKVTQTIVAPDPVQAGAESARAMRRFAYLARPR